MARAAAKAAAPAVGGSNFPVLKDKATVEAVEEYCTVKLAHDASEARLKGLKEQIVAAMGGAPTAYCGAHVLSLTEVKELPATANVKITREMIGTVILGKKGRAGYTMLKVN